MEPDPEYYSYRLRRNGLIAMGVGAAGLFALGLSLERQTDVIAFLARTLRDNPGVTIAIVLGYALFINVILFGFLLVLAGLKELALNTSSRARAGLRNKLIGANLLAATLGYVGLEDVSPSLAKSQWYEWGIFVLPPAAWLGVTLLRRGFAYDAASATEVLSSDARPPVVYIRSFQHDDDRLIPWWMRIFYYWLSVSFEQMLAVNLNPVGPFVAIGDPKEDVPELGAARLYCEDAEWQNRVTDLIKGARLVVIRLGGTANLWWEIEVAVRTAGPQKLIAAVVEKRKTAEVLLAGLERVVGRELRPPEDPSERGRPWSRVAWGLQSGLTNPPLFVAFDPDGKPRFERCQYRLGATMLLHPLWPSIQHSLRRLLRAQGIEPGARKSRVTAFVLALLLGSFGAHHFYTGERRRGVKYLIFCWTAVPAVLGLRDAVRIALESRAAFEGRHSP